MKKKKLDFIRLFAVLIVILTIVYFNLNIFLPLKIPKSLRIGILRKPMTLLILGTDVTYDAVTLKPIPGLEGRADTILLARIDPIHYKINILSVPRDTVIDIPGYGTQKINAANVFGGVALLAQSVTDLTGVKIDYYAKINPTAVIKLVDLAGGVYLDVEKNMYYTDKAQGLKIDLKKGWQRLSGKQAHDYIRFRHDFYGDLGRIKRQQQFLKALAKELTKPSNILKAPSAIRTALTEIKTNLPLIKTIRLLNLSRMISVENIKTAMLPGDDGRIKGAGAVWVPKKAELRRITKEFF